MVTDAARADAESLDLTGYDGRHHTARNLARAILVVVFCASGLVALLEVWQTEHHVQLTALAVVLMAGLLAIQLTYFSRPDTNPRSWTGYGLLALLGALAYVPMPLYGPAWLSLPPFLAGCALLALPVVAARLGFALVLLSLGCIRLLAGMPSTVIAYGVLDDAVFALVVFLLTRLAGLASRLNAARDEVARMAVAEERLRFARDLDDLLGLRLSAIALKCELAHRLLEQNPERAGVELGEVLDITRRALTDARSTASGYRAVSLDREIASAESVLLASGIAVRMALDYGKLPPRVGSMLGAALRVGVTNVVRYRRAEHCDIAVGLVDSAAVLEIVSDGDAPVVDPDAGADIRDLAARLATVNGEVVTGVRADGRFRLRARIPLPRGNAPDAGEPAATRPATPPLPARPVNILVNLALTGIAAGAAIHLWTLPTGPWATATGIACLVALLALQLGFVNRPNWRPGRAKAYGLLLLQACLIYLPVLQLGANWVSIPGWLGASALLLLRPVAGWTVFAVTVGSVIWVHAVIASSVLDLAFYTAGTVITGLIAYGLTSLTRLVADLDATRKHLAMLAVAEERLRFARDLHDLLGLSLSAIALKCGLAGRLLNADPVRAAEELGEVLLLVRKALADVRSVAGGSRELPLDAESRLAESVLTAADVRVHTDFDHTDLPVRVRTLLAVVLREGVTNVLRHSRARDCDIVLRQSDGLVSLAIVNDGLGLDPDGPPASSGVQGSGIRNLSERVAALGGQLECGQDPTGRYRLMVSVPL